jgi:hypothetical protein
VQVYREGEGCRYVGRKRKGVQVWREGEGCRYEGKGGYLLSLE